MKIFRLFVATMFVAAIATVPTFAQAKTGAAAAKPAAAPPPAQASGPVPASKIAYVNSLAFADEKVGITRYVNARKSLEREFQPRSTELQTLAKKIQTLAD
jgi:hypothetical protein